MASIGGSSNKVSSSYDSSVNYTVPLILMVSLFFMIGFITVLNDVLIPSLKGLFELKPWQAMLIQFCFFGAYFVMSYPAGIIIQKIGYKKGLTLALGLMGLGLLLFVPASMVISYGFFLFALFVVACGLTVLQVAINPYIIALGPEETGASRLNLGGALNSTATFIGPIIGAAYILTSSSANAVQQAEAVRGPYIVLALITFAIAGLLYFIQLPKIQSEASSDEKLEGSATQFKHLLYGAGAIFFYVGAEVAIGSILILYLVEGNLIKISAEAASVLNPEKAASSLVAYYWGSAMIGRLIGSAIGQKVRAEVMLSVVSIIAFVLVGVGVSGVLNDTWMDFRVMVLNRQPFSLSFELVSFPVTAFLFVLVGLFNSVMWPCIFPLSLNGLGKYTSQGSGIVVMMVVGGAIIPLIQGALASVESIGYQMSFLIVLVCYAYIIFFGLKGYKPESIDSIESGDNTKSLKSKALADA